MSEAPLSPAEIAEIVACYKKVCEKPMRAKHFWLDGVLYTDPDAPDPESIPDDAE